MRWIVAMGACAAAALGLTAHATAAVQTDLGVLTCTLIDTGRAGSTEPDSQSRAMICSFKPKGNGPEESYTGAIRKIGSKNALTGKQVLIWAVMGPKNVALKPAALEQTYIGEVPSAVDDPADPPKMLVGDRDPSYGLRPITDKGEPNASQSVTVVELKINSTPT